MEASGSVIDDSAARVAAKGEYLVLQQMDKQPEGVSTGIAVYVVVPGVSTIREAFGKNGEGVYVRVPRRSWKPQTVKVEKVDRVKIT